MRWLAPLGFALLSDVAGWSSGVACIRVGGGWWWWQYRLGPGSRLPCPDLAQAWAFARGVDNEDGGDEGGGGEERAGGGKKDVTWRRLNRITQYGQFPNLDKYYYLHSFGFRSGRFREWHSCLHSGNMQIPLGIPPEWNP